MAERLSTEELKRLRDSFAPDSIWAALLDELIERREREQEGDVQFHLAACLSIAEGAPGWKKFPHKFEATRAVAKLRVLAEALKDIAEYDCSYEDNCPGKGESHYRCIPCKARKALEELPE